MALTSSTPPASTPRSTHARDPWAVRASRAIVVGALLGLVGTAAMALAHSGVPVPFADRLGPTRLIPPALVGFSIGALLYAMLLIGGLRRRRWALPVGLLVHALAVATALTPVRGWISVAAIVVGATSFAVLLTPPARRVLSNHRSG